MTKKNDNQTGKRLKISKAQGNMFGAVAGAAVALGMCLVLGVYFLKYIRFNSAVLSAKNEALKSYSTAIKELGVCRSSKKDIYTSEELAICDPNETRVSEVPNSLRYNVMVTMAQNSALESVGRNGLTVCVDSSTGEKMSYKELFNRYENATNEDDRAMYLEIFGMCSALRAIPDALPSAKNELALMASLDKIFKMSEWEPDSIAPGGDAISGLEGLGAISVNLSVHTTNTTTVRVLRNIEKSIREFSINSATIEWSGNDQLSVVANGVAYYTEEAGLNEGIMTVRGDGKVSKTGGSAE